MKDKKEHNIGILLILMIVVIVAILSAINIDNRWSERVRTSQPFIYNGEVYSCKILVPNDYSDNVH